MPRLKATVAFDAYADNVREATLLFMMTGPSRARWGIEWYPFSRMNLQLGNDGGARVIHGLSRSDAITFIFQAIKTPHEVLFDGHAMKWHEMAVLSPSAHFTFAAATATQWFALTVPTGLIGEPHYVRERGISFSRRNVAISLAADAAARLVTAAKRARNHARRGAERKTAFDGAALEAPLLAALDGALTSAHSRLRLSDRHHESLASKMAKALEYVRSRDTDNIQVEEIARAAGISARALQRCFQTYLRMAPKEYLKFRQLNLVRRGLRLDPLPEGTKNHITRILASYGVTEFGRFAVEYRRLFHELPSETLARRAG